MKLVELDPMFLAIEEADKSYRIDLGKQVTS
jgi:hypothetical protein